MNRFLFSAAVGAAAMYFLDPQAGPRRREQAREAAERIARRLMRVKSMIESRRAPQDAAQPG